jgi:hypothetical protein
MALMDGTNGQQYWMVSIDGINERHYWTAFMDHLCRHT